MSRSSNCCANLLNILNLCALVLGVAAIVVSVYFQIHGGTACQKSLRAPLLITGIVLSVVSLVGLIGSNRQCRVNFLVSIYLFAMLLLLVGFIIFTAFTFLITNNGAGKAVSGLGFEEHHLGNYSTWLQKHFVNKKNWEEIRYCLIDAHVCKALGREAYKQTAAQFLNRKLSPIQSGCCKPPIKCGFEYQNATFWRVPTARPAVQDRDCILWSNQQRTLCYDCNACKAGVVAEIKSEWRSLALLNGCVLALLIFINVVACCASRKLKTEADADRYSRLRY